MPLHAQHGMHVRGCVATSTYGYMSAGGLPSGRPISAPLTSSFLSVLLSAEFSALHAELIYLFHKLWLGLGGSIENPAGAVTLNPGGNLPAVGVVIEELLLLAGVVVATAAAAAAAVAARVRCG